MDADTLSRLKEPFDPGIVSWRVGRTSRDKKKGLALAYIDARDVYERLDTVLGPANWQCRYPHADKKTVCEIGVRIEGEWVWKANGAGDSDIEAEKGALSDALKRAAVVWGVGRYLYDLKSAWVELDCVEKDGKTYVRGIKDSELTRLAALLPKPAKPEPSHAERTQAAITSAQRLVNLAAMAGDSDDARAQFRDENAELIARCSKYPEAHKILQDAELA